MENNQRIKRDWHSYFEELKKNPEVSGLILLNFIFFFRTYSAYPIENLEKLVENGALMRKLFIEGQYYRVITSAFLHGGYLHLFFNCFAIWELGRLFGRLYSRYLFIPVFLFSVVSGGALSILGSSEVTVGASGGIFGIAGLILISSWKNPHRMNPRLRQYLLKVFSLLIGFNLILGFFIPQIDNLSHLGGLIAGALAGFVIVPGKSKKSGLITGITICLVLASLFIHQSQSERSKELTREFFSLIKMQSCYNRAVSKCSKKAAKNFEPAIDKSACDYDLFYNAGLADEDSRLLVSVIKNDKEISSGPEKISCSEALLRTYSLIEVLEEDYKSETGKAEYEAR